MEINKSYSFEDFQPWSGAKDTWENLEEYGKIGTLEMVLEDLYPDGIDETTLNDILWFEEEVVYDWVGLYYNPETGVVSDEPLCYSCNKHVPTVKCDECLELVCNDCAVKSLVRNKKICRECSLGDGIEYFCDNRWNEPYHDGR